MEKKGSADIVRLWRVNSLLCLIAWAVVQSRCVQSLNEEGQLLLGWKRGLEDYDNNLGDWNPADATPCLWTGVNCTQDSVSAIDFANMNIAGPLPKETFGKFASLTILNVGGSNLGGVFPGDIVNCSKLVRLQLNFSYIGGEVPSDISNLKLLQVLDLSGAEFNGTLPNTIGELQQLQYLRLHSNYFEGPVPESISSLTKLQNLTLSFNFWSGTLPSGIFTLPNLKVFYLGNDKLDMVPFPDLNLWENMEELRFHNVNLSRSLFPTGVAKMTNLVVLQLSWCNLTGPIPAFIRNLKHLEVINLDKNMLTDDIPDMFGTMTNFTDLSVQENKLTGPLPATLWQCRKLTILFLFDNLLQGNITGIVNFSGLTKVDISGNNFTGPIPPAFGNLTRLIRVNLSLNNLTGQIPSGVSDWTEVVEFRLNNNRINGPIPYSLGTKSVLEMVDLGFNNLEGLIPPNLCRGDMLGYLSLQSNNLTGVIPETYGNCTKLETAHFADNQLQGPVPAGLWGGSRLSRMFLNDNNLNGTIAASIGGATNLSLLQVHNNRFSGPLPEEIEHTILRKFLAHSNKLNGTLPVQLGKLTNLTELSLGANSFGGSIPSAISKCEELVQLDLSRNDLEGAILEELAALPKLANLDLSENNLTGPIPEPFFTSNTLKVLNVAFNNLSGVIPNQENSQTYVIVNITGNPYLCVEGACYNSSSVESADKMKGWTLAIGILAAIVFMLIVVSLIFVHRYKANMNTVLHRRGDDQDSWTVTSFHKKIYYDHEVTDLQEENLIGAGGSGKVYKATLDNGELVAVKKLWGVKNDARSHDHGFRTEVSTLATIRHRHIVKLLCCCTKRDSNLLVYEYMPNGSLGDFLHSTKAATLTWDLRYRIAVGAAMGLQYLHHDCKVKILHRDIKSNNILLDLDYEAHLADFGIAKIVETADSRDLSTVAGSLGYIAPEYAFSMRVDEKSDIYSFGVVLLELVTGKPAVDSAVFGEGINLVHWVTNKLQTQGVHEILDLNCAKDAQDDMIAFLRVALLCTSFKPANRPSMRSVVALLVKAAPKSGIYTDASKDVEDK